MAGDAQQTAGPPRPRPRPTPAADPPRTSATPKPTDVDPAEVPRTPSGGTGRLRVLWILVAVLVVAVVVAAGRLVQLEHRAPVRSTQPSVNDSGTYTPGSLGNASDAAAVRAAVQYLPAVLSYDFRSLDAGLAKAVAHLTPDFRTQFTNTFDDTVRPVAVKNKAVVRTLIRAAGIADRNGDTASVLVFVDQALVAGGSADSGATGSGATGATSPKISQDRVHVDLIRSHGAWLIAAVTPF